MSAGNVAIPYSATGKAAGSGRRWIWMQVRRLVPMWILWRPDRLLVLLITGFTALLWNNAKTVNL